MKTLLRSFGLMLLLGVAQTAQAAGQEVPVEAVYDTQLFAKPTADIKSPGREGAWMQRLNDVLDVVIPGALTLGFAALACYLIAHGDVRWLPGHRFCSRVYTWTDGFRVYSRYRCY